MATYWDDFGTYAAGTQPTGWGLVWHSVSWLAQTDATAQFGGKALVKTGSWGGFLWNAPSNDAQRADVEITARWKVDSFSNLALGLMARGSAPSNQYNGYFAGYDAFGHPRIYKYVNSALTEIGLFNGFAHTTGTWYRVRFQVVGTTLRAKWWDDGAAEPGAWTIEVTDSSHTAAGFVGVAAVSQGRYDWVGVATGAGQTAPTAPPQTVSGVGAIASGAALGTPKLNLKVTAAGAIAPAAAVGAPSVTRANPAIRAVGLAPAATLAAPTLEWKREAEKVIWVAELYPVDLVAGEERVIRLSTDDYVDPESGAYYEPELLAPPTWGRSMASANNISGEALAEIGGLQVAPGYHRRTWTDPTRWSWGERRVVLAAGDPSWPRSAFKTFQDGKLQGPPLGGLDRLDFAFVDASAVADRPAVVDRYLGLGYGLWTLGASTGGGSSAGPIMDLGGLGLTVAALVNPAALDALGEVQRIAWKDTGSAGYRIYLQVPNSTGVGTWRIFSTFRGLTPLTSGGPELPIDYSRIYEVVVSYLTTDNTIRYMVDGEIVGETVCTGTVNGPNTADLAIGGGSGRGHLLSHVRVYQRGFSAEELLTKFRRAAPSSDPDVGAWWPLNDGAGATAIDRGPGGHHLTLNAASAEWRHSNEGPPTLAGTIRRPVIGLAENVLPPLVNPNAREYSVAGHADNRQVRAVYSDGVELVRSETDHLQLVVTATAAGYLYTNLNPGSVSLYTVEAGDVLAFEVYWPDVASPNTLNGSLDVMFSNGTPLRDAGVADQRGLSAHPTTNLSSWARNAWYDRRIPIGSKAGLGITKWGPATDGIAGAGTITLRVRNVRIVDTYGSTKFTLWRAGTTLPGSEVWLRNPVGQTFTLGEPDGDWIATAGERGFRLFEPAGGATITADVEGLLLDDDLAHDVSAIPELVLNRMGEPPAGSDVAINADSITALQAALEMSAPVPIIGIEQVPAGGGSTDHVIKFGDGGYPLPGISTPENPDGGKTFWFYELRTTVSETVTLTFRQHGTVFQSFGSQVVNGVAAQIGEFDAATLPDPSGRGIEFHAVTTGSTLKFGASLSFTRSRGRIGDWPAGEETKRDLLNRFFGSIDGWWGINATGELSCGLIEHPDAGYEVSQAPVALEAVFTVGRGGGPARIVASIEADELPYVILAGDRLVYEIIWDDAEGSAAPHIVVTGRVNDGGGEEPLEDWGLVDQHGFGVGPDVDLSDVAGGRWLERSIDLSSLTGDTLTGIDLACHADLPGTGFGTATARVRRIVVLHADGSSAVTVFEPDWFPQSGFLIPPPMATVIEAGTGEGLELADVRAKLPPAPDVEIPEEAIVSVRPIPVPPPIWEQVVSYRRVFHVSTDLASAATADRKELVARELRQVTRRRQAIRDSYAEAVSAPTLDTFLVHQQDAEALADWRLDIHGLPERAFEVEVTPDDATDYLDLIGRIDIAQRALVLHRDVFTRLVGPGKEGEYFRILAVRGTDNGLLTLTVWRSG